MNIRLSKDSEVPLRRQLAEQVVFLITTGKLRAGEHLPSVRELARRLKIHHNTVSQAYQDLVRRTWVTRQRGSRLVVGLREVSHHDSASDNLDVLINASIRSARDMGFSLQTLRQRVRERLLAQPPDHFLVVERDPGLREIMRQEIQQALGWPVQACSCEEIATAPGLLLGAQVVAPQHVIEHVERLAPKHRPPIPITYSGADEHVELIRGLREPSIIGIVSVSEVLLNTARGFFAPAVGRYHTLRECLLRGKRPADLRAVDVAFCDSLAMSLVKSRRKLHYRLIDPRCFNDLAAAVEPVRRF